MEKLDKDSFRYQVEVAVDHLKGKLYSSAVEKILRKLGINIFSYGVNIERIERSNAIQALKLETLKNLSHNMITLYIERDQERIRHLLKHGYIDKEGLDIDESKGKIYIVIMEEGGSFIVLRGEIIGDRIVI